MTDLKRSPLAELVTVTGIGPGPPKAIGVWQLQKGRHMGEQSGSRLLARALKGQGVEQIFRLASGHVGAAGA